MTKRVVVHQDDVGMCHGANVAFLELAAAGVVTSGSVMVPCPGFGEVAAAAADDEALDLGVHLTLTAEKASYRWGPISAPAATAGMTDDSGSFWRDVKSVRRHADPQAVELELRAQVDRALAADRRHPPRRPHGRRAGAGLTFLALHPNAPGELEAIEPATAHIRTDEYHLLRDERFLAWWRAQDVEPIGMRALRDTLRAR